MKINFDYFKIFKEPVLFAVFIVRHWLMPRKRADSNAALIVNICLIGEFAASVPAMHAYIERHKGIPVDLLVSPAVKDLSQRLRGVRKIYVAQSVFAREIEKAEESHQSLDDIYSDVLVMRISPGAYRLLDRVSCARIKTGFATIMWYGFHLGWNLFRGRTPLSWRQVSFRIVGEPERDVSLGELFDFASTDSVRNNALSSLAIAGRKVIIHTGPSLSSNRWPAPRWVTLLSRLHALGNLEFIFIGAERDRSECADIAAALPFPTHILAGDLSLVDLVLLLRSSDYFIGVDSGPRNLAHMTDLPSITLLGPGPHMYTPPNPRDIVLDHSGGRGFFQRFFPPEHNRFIDRISPEEAFEAFLRLQRST